MCEQSNDSDFDLAAYRRLLQAAKAANYSFDAFSSIQPAQSGRSCLLRHDIDSELLGCGPFLDIERELGVQATYFVMTRSTAYNLFCAEAVAMIRRIIDEGHWLGLHFMGERVEGKPVQVVRDEVLREVRWLEGEFDVPVRTVSFHQPTQAILDGQIEIPGLINTYNRSQLSDYFYVSDTNMIWRHEHPREIFAQAIYPRLQLLIHPIWWTEKPMAMLDKWRSVLRANQEAVVDHWQSRERTLCNVDLLVDRRVGRDAQ